MFLLVTGGSGSGKSAYAEEQIVQYGPGKRVYIATMQCFDEESRRRIARHQEMRKDKCFETIECPTGLNQLKLSEDSIVLLECMSNLTANEMFSPQGAGEQTVSEILEGIRNLKERTRLLVVVTNEIFSDGVEYTEDTLRYQKYLGEINREMGKMADVVTEVVYGIPLERKKEEIPDESV